MKRRHPRQIMDHREFRPGDEYALIRATECDAPERAFVSRESMTFVEAIDNGEMDRAVDALARRPAKEGDEIRITTHDIHGEIVVASWTCNDALCDKWAFYEMDHVHIDKHLLFVPSSAWDADPRVHVIGWLNPDDVCEARLTWAEEEAVLRQRRDIAMRKALGFE